MTTKTTFQGCHPASSTLYNVQTGLYNRALRLKETANEMGWHVHEMNRQIEVLHVDFSKQRCKQAAYKDQSEILPPRANLHLNTKKQTFFIHNVLQAERGHLILEVNGLSATGYQTL